MNPELHIAYCGLYCGDCIIRNGKLATLANQLLIQMRKPEFEKLIEGLPKIMPEPFESLNAANKCIRFLESVTHLDCVKICKDGGGSSSSSRRSAAAGIGL